MRSLLSGAVMNELVSPDDLTHSLSALEEDPMNTFKGLVKGSGRDIKVKRC
jgi:hypothetical protein